MCASLAFGANWNPTPLVIDTKDVVEYAFDGSVVDITFDTTGKPAMVWLFINTMLDDADKPAGIMNGFKGWHFVNGIDTTIYVSSSREFDPGTGNVFPWDGHGNEREYENYMDSGVVASGTYSYYLWGYDNKSSREVANDFIPIGHFMHLGSHSVVWDASGNPAGVYFYTVTAGDYTKTMKMVLMK